jgi:2OG-Fe(II) oxygenase superfamily
MAEGADNPPQFQMVATARGFLTDAEMDELLAEHEATVKDALLGAGEKNTKVRRSQVAFFGAEAEHRWLYERVWECAQEINRQGMGVEISGLEGNIQLARYDSSEQGFYDWHTDFAGYRPLRSEDYDGGDLELFFLNQPQKVERARGALIAFPSFVLHRVAPVTRGTRWSLVAWVLGKRWR